jgi:hypothetical protein
MGRGLRRAPRARRASRRRVLLAVLSAVPCCAEPFGAMGDALLGADSVAGLLVMLRDLDRPGWISTPGSASVDYCEKNYELGDDVAEGWAALASVGGAVLGLGGAMVSYRHELEPRITLLWILGAWWALGTAMMVSTATDIGQTLCHRVFLMRLWCGW